VLLFYLVCTNSTEAMYIK